MTEPDYLESEKCREAIDKLNQVGPLGMTAHDYEDMGSTVSEKMLAEPGRPQAELMSDKEITDFLDKLFEHSQEVMALAREDPDRYGHVAQSLKRTFTVTLGYLRGINRLSDEYKDMVE